MSINELKRSVTSIEAIAIVVGAIIGSGIFLKPGVVFNNAGSSNLGILAWVVGGIITLASALTIAEVAAAIPRTGGLYIYLEELYGDVWGFLLGWVQTVITYPATIAAHAIAFITFSTFFIPMNGVQQKLMAIGFMIFLLIMNILATKFGSIIQVLSTVGKLIPIVAIITYGLIKGTAHDFSMIQLTTTGAGFGVAMLGTLWAYNGWIHVTNMAGELKDPVRQIPRSLIIGVLAVIAIYVLVNVAMLNVLPVGNIISSKNPAIDIATILFGSSGAAFIVAGIMVSVFGTMNGDIMTGARVPFAMADRRQLPFHKILSRVHPSFKTPTNALILECAIAVIYIVTGSFHMLTDLLIFVLWIFYTLGVVSIFVLRRKKNQYQTKYHVPLYPWVPLIGIVGGIYVLGCTVVNQTINSFIGIGITLLGFPLFYYLKKRNKEQQQLL